ncbi:MAG: glucoamylase family protein, partial [Chthoniobacterales bacterium]
MFRRRLPGDGEQLRIQVQLQPDLPRSAKGAKPGWISQGYYGLDQGPIVMMIENYRSGF